jgi:hypothetical protein
MSSCGLMRRIRKAAFSKTVAVLALAASLGVTGASPSLAGSQGSIGTGGWTNTNASAAQSRANLAENVLTRAAVTKVKYLRSVVSPLLRANAFCTSNMAAPLLTGGNLYASTNEYLSKYDPATGKLLWRVNPNPNGSFIQYNQSLAASAGLVVIGAEGCGSASTPAGFVRAFNASTGALAWIGDPPDGLNQAVVVGTSYVVMEGADAEGISVVVLHLKDGTLAWQGHTSGCYAVGPDDPVVVGQMVMRGNCDNQGNPDIEALNIATGAPAWSHPGGWEALRGDLAGSAGSHLYARNPSRTVVDLNPQTGKVEYSLSGAVTVLAVDTSRVYATCGSQGGWAAVCAYSIGTGRQEWRKAVRSTSVNMAAEAGGVLYLDAGYALNGATGQVIKRIWFNAFGSPTAMAVGDGRIAVVSDPRVLDLYGLPGY